MTGSLVLDLAASLLSVVTAVVAVAIWIRKKVEKWLQRNTIQANEDLKKEISKAIHDAIPNSPILSGTYAATRQLYTNGGSTLADDVKRSVNNSAEAVSLGKENAKKINEVGEKLQATNVELALLSGRFREHVHSSR